jgi:predicted lipoprotein with Yx(FWY)xxD motif
MAKIGLLISTCAACFLWCSATDAQTVPTPTGTDVLVGYPQEVALSQEGSRGWVYRRFPGGKRLYVSDLDRNGMSVCNQLCEGAHTPVYAPADAQPKALWSIVKRYDGTRQWAYKGHPIYTLYHDDPAAPSGDGEAGVWHILPFTPVPETAQDVLTPDTGPVDGGRGG